MTCKVSDVSPRIGPTLLNGELQTMSRRFFGKDFRNHQARYGLSVKDEAEWMENDAAARWLQKNGNRALRKPDHRLSDQQATSPGMKLPPET